MNLNVTTKKEERKNTHTERDIPMMQTTTSIRSSSNRKIFHALWAIFLSFNSMENFIFVFFSFTFFFGNSTKHDIHACHKYWCNHSNLWGDCDSSESYRFFTLNEKLAGVFHFMLCYVSCLQKWNWKRRWMKWWWWSNSYFYCSFRFVAVCVYGMYMYWLWFWLSN